MTQPIKKVEWGPCCFCGEDIPQSDTDPCRLEVTTSQGKWQVWFCHAACFKKRIFDSPALMGMLDPAHF